MVASDVINRIGRPRVLLIKLLLQQVSFQVVDDVRLVGDVASIQQVVIDLVLDDFLVHIGVLLLVDEIPLIGARVKDLKRERREKKLQTEL
jgi:hypothetical protein